MRVPAFLLAIMISAPLLAAGPASDQGTRDPSASATSKCQRTTSYLADKSGLYRGERLTPKKLTELPPATTYMAVFRHIGGCEAPLTMVEYRNPRQR